MERLTVTLNLIISQSLHLKTRTKNVIWEELNEVRRLKRIIRDTERILEALKRAVLPKVPVCNGMPKSKPADSVIERLTVRIVDTENEIATLHQKVAETAAELERKIKSEVEGKTARTILILRYVDCMNFRDIGFALGYSETHIYFLHRKICKKIIVDFS